MQAASVAPAGVSSDSVLKLKLSRALLHFQDRLLEGNITPGSLCQVQPHCAVYILLLAAHGNTV